MSNISDESFRDSIATITTEGKRNFIFPKKFNYKFFPRPHFIAENLYISSEKILLLIE